MTREEFIQQFDKHEKTIRIYLEQGLSSEALELAQDALDDLENSGSLASTHEFQKIWDERRSTFKGYLSRARELQQKYEDDDLEVVEEVVKTEISPQALCSRGEALMDVGEYDKALDDLNLAYEKGLKEYKVAYLILECLNKKGRLEEQARFIKEVLEETELREEEQAKLYYRLGIIYLHQDKKTQARQALWQVKRIDEDFPGLEDKLKPLEEDKGQSKSRYDLLIREGKITQETLKKVLAEAKLRQEDPDHLLISDYGISKA
ncbi:MAG: tetratricopeptide repeat protein, partial [Desulfovibrionales bacterium]